MSKPFSCYTCGEECELFKKALSEAKDETDVYLIHNSVKHGCPKKLDEDNPCYPLKEREEESEQDR